jgi:hypothetical protein
MEPKETITITEEIPPETTEEFAHEFKAEGTISGISIDTYRGHEFGLRYFFVLAKNDGENALNLFQPIAREFLAGNGESFDIGVRRGVEQGDVLTVTVQNISDQFLYHANARIEVDQERGPLGQLMAVIN